MFAALKRYHVTMVCVCHPEWIALHRRARLARIPGVTDDMAMRITARHRFRTTRVILRYDGHEHAFEVMPRWADGTEIHPDVVTQFTDDPDEATAGP